MVIKSEAYDNITKTGSKYNQNFATKEKFVSSILFKRESLQYNWKTPHIMGLLTRPFS